MTKTTSLLGVLAVSSLALAGLGAQEQLPAALSAAASEIRADRLASHMAHLADDTFEGRETGTRGFVRAARYVIGQFEALGLRPVAGSYEQRLTIRRARVDEARSSLTISRDGARWSLTYGTDFVTYGDTDALDVRAGGELVFVGDGVTVPHRGIDAYRGVSAAGTVVIALPGAPATLTPSEQSYYESAKTKAATAAAHGATALLLVAEEHIPWDLRVRSARQLGATESLPEHQPGGLKTIVYLSRAAAERILGQPLDGMTSGKPASVGSVSLHVRNERRDVQSANVYALLPGSDPKLSAEYVIYTAHLDHIGIGEPVDGDRIYNGAVDNASGVAGMLGIASAFKALPRLPARSILFLATTGEEQGEIGADYFVRHPPVPIDRIVASVNIDGLSFFPFDEIVAGGGALSSLGRTAEDAGKQLGVRIGNESIGVDGSDHAPFLLARIPVLWLQASLSDEWMQTRYHTPRDDMSQPLDFNAAARYTRVAFVTGYLAAQTARRPTWNRGEFFASAIR